MQEISPTKVAHVIIKARECEAKVASWNDDQRKGDAEEDPDSILEDFGAGSAKEELVSFIRSLNEDEQAELVALTWVGRGTFSAEEFDEAVDTARAEHVNATDAYLLGIPLLAEYLEEGLERMGLSASDAEDQIL